jgi:hydrogenase maturation protein HypF
MAGLAPMAEARRITVTGTVQGVGFRPYVYRHAVELGLAGEVSNGTEGVRIDAVGSPAALDELCRRLREEPPPLARVHEVRVEAGTAVPVGGSPRLGGGFRIVASRDRGRPDVPVSADVGPCDACLAELEDPADRRFRYPFINCTDCGPRYTITRRVPYDRPWTTMADFTMCETCQAEYDDPSDRRFHAQPNACPACGPQLALNVPGGAREDTTPGALNTAVRMLRDGRIVAVKGVGGFHLACDATDPAAVGELRRRKARDDKPFAVLVADVATAHRLCVLDDEAEAAIAAPQRPIVLAPRRSDSAVSRHAGDVASGRGDDAASGRAGDVASGRAGDAASGAAPIAHGVAPGLPELGMMLPPSPLHHLLVRDVGLPLVLTSGNLSDEPIAYRDPDAFTRLGPLVDAVLTHDRPIHIRCDDSVVRAAGRPDDPTVRGLGRREAPGGRAAGGLQVLRRSRGLAPEPVSLPVRTAVPILAVGAELKSTVALARADQAVVSHHLGDLEHHATYVAFVEAVAHLSHLAGTEPELVVHDLHPQYLSTTYALELGLPTHGVQHHHAHIASCLVDNGRDEPVLGVSFDGTGYGPDGTVWGGEFLVADLRSSERVGRLRQVALPGGAAAIREPWRMALAWLAATEPGRLAELGPALDRRWEAVASLLDHPRTLRTSSAGRLFDAVAALLGVRSTVTYEGQAAIELESLARRVPIPADADVGSASRTSRGAEGSTDPDPELRVLDPAPLIAAAIRARRSGEPLEHAAADFHTGFAAATARLALEAAEDRGLRAAALSGGVFQNPRFSAEVARHLRAGGLDVLTHRAIPPNDGGISVGQAAVAAARTGSAG